MGATTTLLTFEEFENLPEAPGKREMGNCGTGPRPALGLRAASQAAWALKENKLSFRINNLVALFVPLFLPKPRAADPY